MSLSKRVILVSVTEYTVIALMLFGFAGTVAWIAGWIFLLSLAIFSLAMVTWLLKHSPGLLEERLLSLRRSPNRTDRVFIWTAIVLFVGWLAIVPLDAGRYHWTEAAWWLQWLGGALYALSLWLYWLVFRENPYLSASVRVQAERGQKTIDTGPYRWVRHPMYLASLLFFLGGSLLMGSCLGTSFTLLLAMTLATRAVGEERLLREELPGYAEYMQKVRYRLVPRVW